LIRKGAKVTFPIVKLSPIRLQGKINRIRVEIEGTDKKMYLVDPSDILIVDEEGGLTFNVNSNTCISNA
jgi:hypothetical protein